MSTILIYNLKTQNLIKVIYTQGNAPNQTLEEYPDHHISVTGGQVHIIPNHPVHGSTPGIYEPILSVPTSRTIIKTIN